MPKPSPFDSFEIKKGQSRGLGNDAFGGFFSNLFKTFKKDSSGEDSSEKIVGYFKGIVQVESKKDRAKYDKEKKKLIDELIKLCKDHVRLHPDNISNTELEFELDNLAIAEERKKFDLELRKFDLGMLNITHHLTNLNSDEILKQ